jgi:hypothetical protein
MADPKRPTDAKLEAEVAEVRRFAQMDLLPAFLANPSLSPDQILEMWKKAAARADLIGEQERHDYPPLEQVQQWKTEIRRFFEELKAEFPATHQDPAFRAAVLARIPVLVKHLMRPGS